MEFLDEEWIKLVKLAQESGKTKEEFQILIENYLKKHALNVNE